jgi:hypothetical protein
MRRWCVILASLVALIVAGAVFVSLRMPSASFAFLLGHEPLCSDKLEQGPGPVTVVNSTYSFRADWQIIRTRASEELRGLGFKVRALQNKVIAHRKDKAWAAMLEITPNIRYDPNHSTLYTRAEGWVLVETRTETASFWQRVKASFGF